MAIRDTAGQKRPWWVINPNEHAALILSIVFVLGLALMLPAWIGPPATMDMWKVICLVCVAPSAVGQVASYVYLRRARKRQQPSRR